MRRVYVEDEENYGAEREYESELEDYSTAGFSEIDWPEVDDLLVKMTPEEFEQFISRIKEED